MKQILGFVTVMIHSPMNEYDETILIWILKIKQLSTMNSTKKTAAYYEELLLSDQTN